MVRTGKPVIVEDAVRPTRCSRACGTRSAARGIHAIAALPLPIRGEVRGVLLLRASGGDRRTFAPREIDFLATVAHATAVALRNASLLQTVRGQTEREKTARIAAEEKAAALQTLPALFAHVSEGVAILDDKACVLSLNPAGHQLLDDARARRAASTSTSSRSRWTSGLMELVTSVARRAAPGRGRGGHAGGPPADAVRVRGAAAGGRTRPPSSPSAT